MFDFAGRRKHANLAASGNGYGKDVLNMLLIPSFCLDSTNMFLIAQIFDFFQSAVVLFVSIYRGHAAAATLCALPKCRAAAAASHASLANLVAVRANLVAVLATLAAVLAIRVSALANLVLAAARFRNQAAAAALSLLLIAVVVRRSCLAAVVGTM